MIQASAATVDFGVSSLSDGTGASGKLDLAVVVPTFNERENIAEFIVRLDQALKGLRWELTFVDDDSPDGTAEIVRGFALRDRRVRLLQRIGRRGLASACIEGVMATSADCVAVMDADMQHDETILPRMLEVLRQERLDIVVATRHAQGGSMGAFSSRRVLLSRLGNRVSHAVCQCELTDPMSGYFLLRRHFFLEVVRRLQGNGFKILVDILGSSARPVRLKEVGYSFRNRMRGDSKLCVHTGVEYLLLVLNKWSGGVLPPRFLSFALIGSVGLVTHLLCLGALLYGEHQQFVVAQAVATGVAMVENFFLNNFVTYRDRILRGRRLLLGLVSFCVACSFGALANVLFAHALFQDGLPWYAAGIAGIVLSSVWNYSVTNLLTWQTPGRAAASQIDEEEPVSALRPSDPRPFR